MGMIRRNSRANQMGKLLPVGILVASEHVHEQHYKNGIFSSSIILLSHVQQKTQAVFRYLCLSFRAECYFNLPLVDSKLNIRCSRYGEVISFISFLYSISATSGTFLASVRNLPVIKTRCISFPLPLQCK